ncbi:MAG: hypothetical protein M5U26_01475 [Planctomycetota bacterium]|nr:hypothetical protein [Planctomycetota bacterium]
MRTQPARPCLLALLLCAALASAFARAASLDEARALKDEAARILRDQAATSADPKLYAHAVFKLQRAEALLDELLKTQPQAAEPLLEEVTASLFWARRFANVNVIRELERGDPGPGAGTAPPPPARPEPPKPAPQAGVDLAAAEKAYKKGEEFERARAGEDHAVALKWFQVADETQGTDWSLRALSRANEAQARFKARQEAAQAAELAPDAKLIVEGNALFAAQKYAEALDKFAAAQSLKNTPLVHQRLGHTHLKLGYLGRDKYAEQYRPMLQKIADAKRSGNQAQMQAVYKENLQLLQRLRPLENEVIGSYVKAAEEFQRGLDLANGKNLDCECHVAILQFERKNRTRALQLLAVALKKYTPANDEERAVYEYSKSLYERLGGKL